MQVLRNGTGVIALDCQIKEPGGADKRRGSVRPFHCLAVDRRMDVEKIAGQHIQRGIGRKLKSERLRVVRVHLDVSQLVRRGRFGFDESGKVHGDAFYGIAQIGAMPAGQRKLGQGRLKEVNQN